MWAGAVRCNGNFRECVCVYFFPAHQRNQHFYEVNFISVSWCGQNMLISVCYVNAKAVELSGVDLMKCTRGKAVRPFWLSVPKLVNIISTSSKTRRKRGKETWLIRNQRGPTESSLSVQQVDYQGACSHLCRELNTAGSRRTFLCSICVTSLTWRVCQQWVENFSMALKGTKQVAEGVR